MQKILYFQPAKHSIPRMETTDMTLACNNGNGMAGTWCRPSVRPPQPAKMSMEASEIPSLTALLFLHFSKVCSTSQQEQHPHCERRFTAAWKPWPVKVYIQAHLLAPSLTLQDVSLQVSPGEGAHLFPAMLSALLEASAKVWLAAVPLPLSAAGPLPLSTAVPLPLSLPVPIFLPP